MPVKLTQDQEDAHFVTTRTREILAWRKRREELYLQLKALEKELEGVASTIRVGMSSLEERLLDMQSREDGKWRDRTANLFIGERLQSEVEVTIAVVDHDGEKYHVRLTDKPRAERKVHIVKVIGGTIPPGSVFSEEKDTACLE